MFRSLMWKEFREHIWKILALVAMLLSPLFVALLWTHAAYDRIYGVVDLEPPIIGFAALIAPVWIASWTIAGEKRGGAGSLNALLSLPASPAVIFAIKTAWGVCSLVLPLLIAFAVWRHFFDGPRPLLETQLGLAIILSSISLYLVILAISIHRQRESTVAMIGVLTVAFFGLWILAFSNLSEHWTHWWLLAPNPFMTFFMMVDIDRVFLSTFTPLEFRNIFTLQILVSVGWWLLAARRFHRAATNPLTTRPSITVDPRRLTMSFSIEKFPFGSLFWKEWREQFPVLVLAAFMTASIPILIVMLESQGRGITLDAVLQIISVTATAMACVTSIVLGVGPLAGDLEPHTRAFWQSQPISFRHWFWTKYVIGLFGTAILLFGFGLLIAAGMIFIQNLAMLNWQANAEFDMTSYWRMFRGGIFILPVVYGLSFFLASAVRHTFYAAILALTLVPLVLFLPWLPSRNGVEYDGLGTVLATGNADSIFILCAVFTVAGIVILAKLSRLVLSRGWHLA